MCYCCIICIFNHSFIFKMLHGAIFYEGSATKEISYTVGRNPIWNPEIQRNPEIHSEVQKSNLKSRNPLWNPEIHCEIRKSNLMTLRVYPYTLITSLCLHGRARIMYDVNIGSNDLCSRPIFGRGQRSFWGDVCIIISCMHKLIMHIFVCVASCPGPAQKLGGVWEAMS